jgi:DNA-binding response OmpR family regulator
MDNSSRPAPKKRILCVEDNEDSCELLKILLHVYDVTIARSLLEARALLEQNIFHLYILDNGLPDGSGMDLCERIFEFNPAAEVVFASAVGHQIEIDAALKAGARLFG